MKSFKRIWIILKRTGTLKIFLSFIIICLIASIIFKYTEDGVNTIGDGLWYSFIASTTIGFGDIYATTLIGRITTIIVALNGMIIFAMMTGVVVSYYTEYVNDKSKKTISLFLEKLENLPNLSKDELKEISEKIKKMKSF